MDLSVPSRVKEEAEQSDRITTPTFENQSSFFQPIKVEPTVDIQEGNSSSLDITFAGDENGVGEVTDEASAAVTEAGDEAFFINNGHKQRRGKKRKAVRWVYEPKGAESTVNKDSTEKTPTTREMRYAQRRQQEIEDTPSPTPPKAKKEKVVQKNGKPATRSDAYHFSVDHYARRCGDVWFHERSVLESTGQLPTGKDVIERMMSFSHWHDMSIKMTPMYRGSKIAAELREMWLGMNVFPMSVHGAQKRLADLYEEFVYLCKSEKKNQRMSEHFIKRRNKFLAKTETGFDIFLHEPAMKAMFDRDNRSPDEILDDKFGFRMSEYDLHFYEDNCYGERRMIAGAQKPRNVVEKKKLLSQMKLTPDILRLFPDITVSNHLGTAFSANTGVLGALCKNIAELLTEEPSEKKDGIVLECSFPVLQGLEEFVHEGTVTFDAADGKEAKEFCDELEGLFGVLGICVPRDFWRSRERLGSMVKKEAAQEYFDAEFGTMETVSDNSGQLQRRSCRLTDKVYNFKDLAGKKEEGEDSGEESDDSGDEDFKQEDFKDDPVKIPCPVCGLEFDSKGFHVIEKHCNRYHAPEWTSDMKMTIFQSIYECYNLVCTCERRYYSANKLERHKAQCRGPQTEFPCKKCTVVCATNSELTRHRNEFHRDPVVCQVCGKSFKLAHYAKKHYNRVHLGIKDEKDEQRQPCHFCGKLLVVSNMMAHIANVHTENEHRPHICDFCGKGFGTKNQLNTHRNGHTGQRSYKCRMCDFTSRYSGSRDTHEKNVHKYKHVKTEDGLLFADL